MAKADVAAVMFARRQIDRVSLDGARRYQAAAGDPKALAQIERRLMGRFGAEGVHLVRGVLGAGQTIESHSDGTKDDARY